MRGYVGHGWGVGREEMVGLAGGLDGVRLGEMAGRVYKGGEGRSGLRTYVGIYIRTEVDRVGNPSVHT